MQFIIIGRLLGGGAPYEFFPRGPTDSRIATDCRVDLAALPTIFGMLTLTLS